MELCINRFIIRSDNLPIILIKSWPLEVALFNGSSWQIPSLYSKDLASSAQTAIKGNPLKAHWDFNKIAKTVFMMESVTTAEALAIIKTKVS